MLCAALFVINTRLIFYIGSLHVFVENSGTRSLVFVHGSRSGVWLEEVGGAKALCMVHTTIIYTGHLSPRCGVTAQGCFGHAIFQQEAGTHSTQLGTTRGKEINKGHTLTYSVLLNLCFLNVMIVLPSSVFHNE